MSLCNLNDSGAPALGRRLAQILAHLLAIATLVACDGGGGGSSGYTDPQAQIRAAYEAGYGKGVGDGKRSILDHLAGQARAVQTELSRVALWSSVLFVTMVLIGPALTERFRFEVQNRLHITPEEQATLVKAAYICGSTVLGLTVVGFERFGAVRIAVLVLLAGTAYTVYAKLVPSIQRDDQPSRKAAFGELKSLVAFMFVLMLAHSMLASVEEQLSAQ